MPWRTWRSILREERRARLKAEARAAELEEAYKQLQKQLVYDIHVMANNVIQARGPVNTFIKGVKEPTPAHIAPVSQMFPSVPPERVNEYDVAYAAYIESNYTPSQANVATLQWMGLPSNAQRNAG